MRSSPASRWRCATETEEQQCSKPVEAERKCKVRKDVCFILAGKLICIWMQLIKLGHYTVLGVGGGVDMTLNTGNTNMHVRGAHELKKIQKRGNQLKNSTTGTTSYFWKSERSFPDSKGFESLAKSWSEFQTLLFVITQWQPMKMTREQWQLWCQTAVLPVVRHSLLETCFWEAVEDKVNSLIESISVRLSGVFPC